MEGTEAWGLGWDCMLACGQMGPATPQFNSRAMLSVATLPSYRGCYEDRDCIFWIQYGVVEKTHVLVTDLDLSSGFALCFYEVLFPSATFGTTQPPKLDALFRNKSLRDIWLGLLPP